MSKLPLPAASCAEGGVAEWLMALVLKTSEGNSLRGFESHPLRDVFPSRNTSLTAEDFFGEVAEWLKALPC
jgi:hypothetical protein